MRLTDEQLHAELTALRETPSEDFAAELDAMVERGFPGAEWDPTSSPSKAKPGPLSRLRLRPLVPAMGMAATLLVVIVAVTSIIPAGDNDDGDGSGDIGPSVAEKPSGAESDEAGRVSETPSGDEAGRSGDDVIPLGPESVEPGRAALPPGPPQDKLKPGKPRIQEKSAAMTLSTEPDEVDDVADGVVEVTERYDGIVVSSNVSTGEEQGRAKFDLRIPSANLQAALADLSDLASVSARDEGTLDITAPFVTAEERFQDAKAEVDALLEQLSEADSSTEIAAIREQLAAARGELAAARSELGALKQRADFSRLTLTVLGDGDADGWSIGDAADDAVSVLEDLAGAGLVTLAVIVPLGGLALILWFGADRLRRRRRESALDD